MSSMVRSHEADNWLTEGSESENSPRTENMEYSPDNRSDGNLPLSPHSLEIANYRKRKIKAIQETEFVKKCKLNYKSGNIIIHSSEDESILVKDENSKNRNRSEKRKVAKPVVEIHSKPPNPYSKIFYHNRKMEDCNKIQSDFSYKSLFPSRKRSNRNNETNKDLAQHTLNSLSKNNNLEKNNEDHSIKFKEKENTNKTDTNTLGVLPNIDNKLTECVGKDNLSPKGVEVVSDSPKKSSRSKNPINDQISNSLTRTKSFESLLTLSPCEVNFKKRTQSLDRDLFTSSFHSDSDVERVPSQDGSSSVTLVPAQESLKVREETSTCSKERQNLNSVSDANDENIPLKQASVVLERIDVTKYFVEENTVFGSEMFKDTKNLESGALSSDLLDLHKSPSSNVSDTVSLCSETGDVDQNEDRSNSLQARSPFIDDQALFKKVSNVMESNDTENSGNVHPSIKSTIELRDGNSNSGFESDHTQNPHQASDKLNNSASPSPPSRPASPSSKDVNSKQECRIMLERLNMDNVLRIMETNKVDNANLPAYFLHLKDSSTNLKCNYPTGNHFVRLINDNSFLKVISVKNNLEMFQINKSEVRHFHLDIDNCRCPLSKKFNSLRGWKKLKEEIKRSQTKVNHPPKATSKPVSKKIQKVVRSKMKPKVKTKLIKKYISDSLKQISQNNDQEENRVFESRDWPSITSKNKLSEAAPVGKVRSMEMVSHENTPKNVYHQPIRINYESIVDARPASTSIIPPDINPISRPSNLIDIYSVKGMIKQRKEQTPTVKGYDGLNLNSFFEEGGFNSKGNELETLAETFAINKPDYIIRPDLLSEELYRSPHFNYNDFLITGSEEIDAVTNMSQDPLFNSCNEIMATNICREKEVLSVIEKAITSNKRKSEMDQSSSKKQRLTEEDSSNSSASENVAEGVPMSRRKSQNLRVKDMSFLMPSESSSLNQVSSSHCVESGSVKGWTSRLDRQQKKVSKRREWYLKEQMKHQESQNSNTRSFSLSKIIGVALNQNPSHIDISRTFNLKMVQVFENNQNRLLFLTKEGATEEPFRVCDSQASNPTGKAMIPKKSLEERSALLKSLSRLHQHHTLFTVSALSSNQKTDQHQNRRVCLVCRSKSRTSCQRFFN